jgi:hypothetical protein
MTILQVIIKPVGARIKQPLHEVLGVQEFVGFTTVDNTCWKEKPISTSINKPAATGTPNIDSYSLLVSAPHSQLRENVGC